MSNPLKKISSKIVYKNPWIVIKEDVIQNPDGSKGIYGYLESRNSCMVIAQNENEEIFLIKAYRYPSNSQGWELPGGGGDNEDLLTASKRELEEETGILANTWEKRPLLLPLQEPASIVPPVKEL